MRFHVSVTHVNHIKEICIMNHSKSKNRWSKILLLQSEESASLFRFAATTVDGITSTQCEFCMFCDSQMMTTAWWQVKSHESNFVYTSHALVIELAEEAYWFWNAPYDAHGSTLNNLALSHPRSYHGYVTLERAYNRAQWTRVIFSSQTH